ncbi:MAG: DUF6249 domain-containing protein [Woeseiaceae bacterium]|nr:DUF6249 domain-containing protein [Woeseiaceae bacterium]
MIEELIPITMFLVIGLVLGLFYYFRYRTRAEMQQTVRVALDKGQALDVELIDRLAEPRKPADADRRKGIMAIFMAIALAAFGVVMDEQDALRALLASATLPLAIGIGYLVLWRLGSGKEDR